jgi:hypothetical protein
MKFGFPVGATVGATLVVALFPFLFLYLFPLERPQGAPLLVGADLFAFLCWSYQNYTYA